MVSYRHPLKIRHASIAEKRKKLTTCAAIATTFAKSVEFPQLKSWSEEPANIRKRKILPRLLIC